ncbi:MAG: glycosyltransferase family 4 protein [Candidatus Helarchaeota archaeon]
MKIVFLSWGSPWPTQGGGTLRTFGLLKQLSKYYEIELVILDNKKLSKNQEKELNKYVKSIIPVKMNNSSIWNKIKIISFMLRHKMPYHCAVLNVTFKKASKVFEYIMNFKGVVYASYGHWGILVRGRKASNWILDQHNADIDFWRTYAGQASNLWLRLVALINWKLAKLHFPKIYLSIGRIVSVCEEDRQLTLSVYPEAKVDVIENGVDCSYYFPSKKQKMGPPQILFTGTSAPRNVTALRQFTHNVWPLIQRELPEVELWVAGNFKHEAQIEFKKYKNIHFTGWIKDIRPYFNKSDVFIAPFEETHGSKLKIAEAMAMGMAIVSTPQGIRGFSLIDGESVLIANDNKQFASHVLRLLTDIKLREKLGVAAREVALSTIDWKVLGKRLKSIVEETYANISD